MSYDDALNNRKKKTNYDLVDEASFVRLDYQTCANVLGPITVKFNPTPIVTSPDIEVKMCDSNDDGIENFNWADLVKNKVTMDAGVSLIRVLVLMTMPTMLLLTAADWLRLETDSIKYMLE